jgi:hypothetical protein
LPIWARAARPPPRYRGASRFFSFFFRFVSLWICGSVNLLWSGQFAIVVCLVSQSVVVRRRLRFKKKKLK